MYYFITLWAHALVQDDLSFTARTINPIKKLVKIMKL
jgi:hypothetical protein